MIYQIRHYHGPAVTTDRIRAFKAIGKTLRRINFGGRTDVSGLDYARMLLNNWSEAIIQRWVMDDDGTVIPVRESDEVIAHIIATSESLSAAAQARRAEPLAIAIPRAPECPIKVLTLPVKVQNGR